MLERVRENFLTGIDRIKWFSSLVSERLKIEISVIRLLNEAKTLEGKKGSEARAAGERVFELKTHENTNVFKDPRIKDALEEMARLDKDIENIKARISELGKIGS